MARKKKLPEGMRLKPSGAIEYRFTVDGKRYVVSGETVKECRKKEEKKREEIASGTFRNREKLTVSEYMAQWLEMMESNVSPATVRTRRKLNSRMIRQTIDKAGHTFGDIRLQELETARAQENLQDDG